MKNNKKILVLVLSFVILLGCAYGLYHTLEGRIEHDQLSTQSTQDPSSPSDSTTPKGPLAPDFSVYDKEGNIVRLSDFLGKKPIVLNFWASWCGPCRSEMPDFDIAYGELKDKVQFLMINMTDGGRETVETASKFVESYGFQFPVFFDTTGQAGQIYQAYGLPTTYFIDKDGYVIAKAQSALDRATLQKGLDMIMN